MELFLRHCDLALAPVPDMEYYSCVGLCALDAVFSIQARYYSVVSPLLDRFCDLAKIVRTAPDSHKLPSVEEQVKISDLVKRLEGYDGDRLAKALKNKQKTSSRNGILKAEAFLEYLKVFQRFGIETFQDVNRLCEESDDLKNALKSIKGQNVAVDYFFMLAGDEDGVKVDTLLTRFSETAVGHPLTKEQIKTLFRNAVEYYREHGYPDMTARHLDHIVWTWQKSR